MGTSRRKFLALLAAGTLGVCWCDTIQAAAEPPPGTTHIRLNKIRSICLASVYVAEALLRAEGFTDVQYIGDGPTGIGGLARRAGHVVLNSAVDRPWSQYYCGLAAANREVQYGRWRDYNPEDTLRFYALRLREARLIGSSPKQLIAQGTDLRFIDQLKRELKT